MNKNFLISWVIIFVVWMAGGFVVHGVLLGADYAALTNIMRPEAEQQSYFHWMLLAHAIMAGAFVWIYNRGNEDKPWLRHCHRIACGRANLHDLLRRTTIARHARRQANHLRQRFDCNYRHRCCFFEQAPGAGCQRVIPDQHRAQLRAMFPVAQRCERAIRDLCCRQYLFRF